jgi:hypothetical protein
MEIDGQRVTCAFEDRTFTCGFERWEYNSAADFIREGRTPNLTLALSRHRSYGVMLFTSGSLHSEYTYDSRGRLLERLRTSSSYFGLMTSDHTHYTAWDTLGRPVRGDVITERGTELITLVYDASRRMLVSNGELVDQDSHGNTVHEVEVFGLSGTSTPIEHTYRIFTSAEVCM